MNHDLTTANQLDHDGEVDPVHPGTAHRHVRAQDLHAGRHLGHQLVRPVGVSESTQIQIHTSNETNETHSGGGRSIKFTPHLPFYVTNCRSMN